MIDKPMYIIIMMYAGSFCFLGAQYFYGDFTGQTMVNFQGVEMKSAILDAIGTGTINQVTTNIININSTTNSTITGIERAFTLGYQIFLELFTILTGTYIFLFLYWLLGPESAIIIGGFVVIYVLMLAWSFSSKIRNG